MVLDVEAVSGFADGDFFCPVDGREQGKEVEPFVTGCVDGFDPLLPGYLQVDGAIVGGPAVAAELGG